MLNDKYQLTNIGPRVYISKYLKYHPTTMKNFEEYGFITNESNYNCKYLVDVKECTKKTLENNGFEIE